MNLLLLLLASFSLFLLTNSATTYYVNEQSQAIPQTGSFANPFTSIAQAYSSLGAITCDLALLGSSASINTTIAFTSGANYTIRPDANFTSSAYFPINFQTGAVIQVTAASLTLQKLRLRELNPSRATNSPLFSTFSGSNLTFQSIQVRDTRTTNNYYFFCKATDSFVNILNSEFRNLTEFEFVLIRSPIVVHGSKFNNLVHDYAPLMVLTSYTGPNNGFTFTNNSFENINIGMSSASGFIYSASSHMNITFEDFYIKNVSLTLEASFLYFTASRSSYYDTQNQQTTLIVRNGVIQNMFETPKSILSSTSSVSKGLFLFANTQTILKAQNLSVTNAIFTNMSMFSFTPGTQQFLNSWKVLPLIELTDITMKYTRNANFLVGMAETVNISNVHLEGLSIENVKTSYALFNCINGHLLNVFNVTANNVTGPMFQSVNILAHSFSMISFNEMYSSQKLSGILQNIIYISITEDLGSIGLDPSRNKDIFFENVNLDGFTFIERANEIQSPNNSALISVHTRYGKIYLTNSVWHNNLLNGLYSGVSLSLQVDNLTISSDPEIPIECIPLHRGIYLKSAKQIVVKNSVFQNNRNFVALHASNVAAQGVNSEIAETYIIFENIIVRNNSAAFYNPTSQYPSLFIIYCPLKPVYAWFNNSVFENNKILNGLINALENYQANLVLLNNTFDSNYAAQSGVVFSSSNMRQQTNVLNITNNTFTNNRCDQNGGVFYFLETDYNMHLVNNTYFNNSAGLNGGVGYAFRASFVFLEEQGVYLNNSAGFFGGTWYISLNTYKVSLQNLEFSQTFFINSIAKQKGGSIYLDNGGMMINDCTFHASQASVAGGNFYISIGGSMSITKTNLTASSAPQGSFLFAEDLLGALKIEKVRVTDISSGSFILAINSGSLEIKASAFENISSPLFLLSSVTTSIKDTTFSQIYCPKTSNSFCVLKAISSNQVEIDNTLFKTIISNADIISISACTKALFSGVTAQNVLKLTSKNLGQTFFLNVLSVQNFNVILSDFFKIGFSSIKAKNSTLNIQDSTFSNRLETDRLLSSQSIDDRFYSAKLTQPIQFIILDSSSSTLIDVTFIENSLNTLVNGGAIQILGSGGVHTLTDCIFENNKASNGGALFVKGQANSIGIFNSQFDNNQVTGNGGALYFADQSVQNTLFISQTTFCQNTATLGGAIYLGTQVLAVDISSFTENTAFKGGAIATKSAATETKAFLRQSSFIKNNASEGAAFIALQKMNLDYSTSSFKQNTALSGGDVASMPTSLRLKIYSFEPYFLFIEDITAKDLLSSSTTVLIYDSDTAITSEVIPFVSGSEPNLLFEIIILDALGEKMSQTNSAQGKFKIANSSSSSSLVGILGTTSFAFTDSTAYVFNDFSVKGPFETTLTLSIETTFVSQTSLLLSLEFPIVLEKCFIGQTYDQSTAICSYCSSNSYSIADPFTNKACQKCFENAVCLGGSITYPAKGYWRIDESSDNLVKCPEFNSCLGGSKDGGKSISLRGFCEEGYEGIACSSCASGYAKFGSSQSCFNCQDSKLYYIMFGGYLLIQTLAIIFSIKMNLPNSLKQTSTVQSTLIKIVVDFVQILTLISEFNFNFPSVVSSLYDGISKILPTNIDALSVDCFIALKKGNNQNVFFYKILVILAGPFAYMIFAYIVWVVIFRMKRKARSDFRSQMLLTIIIIIYVLQPGIIKLVLELFNCKNYGSSDDPKYYLVYDVNVKCWEHEHLTWALSIAIPTLIIGLIVPFTVLSFWTRDKNLKASVRAQKSYTFLFKPYQNNALFWELATLIRKVLLIIISVFITSKYLQAYLGFLLLAFYYCALYKIAPYNIPQLNLAEAISLISSAFILYSGLFFVQAKETNAVSYILFACDIIFGIAFVAYILYVFLKKPAANMPRNLKRLSSRIITNLKLSIPARQQQSPTSGPDSPIATTERCLSTDRQSSPLIKVQPSEEDMLSTRRESHPELLVLSPTNQTEAGLFIFGSQPRGSSDPIDFQSLESPSEEPDFQQFAEILRNETRNSPRISPRRTRVDLAWVLSKRSSQNLANKSNST